MSGAAFRGAISPAVARALELHKAGMPTRKAAAAAGCSHSAVCLRLYGKPNDKPGADRKPDRRNDVLALLSSPHTRRELSEALGVTRATADHHVARLLAHKVIRVAGNRKTESGWSPTFEAIPGATLPPVTQPDRKMHPGRLKLLQTLAGGPLTAVLIAEVLGRTPQSVRRVLADCQPKLVDVAGHGEQVGRSVLPLTWALTAAGREAIK